MLRALTRAAVTQGLMGRIANAILELLVNRLRDTHRAFTHLAARIQAGTFRPRRYAPRRAGVARKPPAGHPITRTFGWLVPLVPYAGAYGSELENMFRDPEMVILMEAAPAAMARMLRPICWALRIKPPAILATARRRPPATPAAPAAPPPRDIPPSPRVPVRTAKPPRAAGRRPGRENPA